MMTNIITIRLFKCLHAEDNDSIPRLDNVQHEVILSITMIMVASLKSKLENQSGKFQ